MSTKLRTTDAFCCLAAAKVFTDLLSSLAVDEGIPAMYLHHIANRDDNCKSYATHKYVPVNRVNEFMRSVPGMGVYGGWSFKDGSMLLVSCSQNGGARMERYTIIQPEETGDLDKGVKSLVDVTHIRIVANLDDFRSEAWDKEPVADPA